MTIIYVFLYLIFFFFLLFFSIFKEDSLFIFTCIFIHSLYYVAVSFVTLEYIYFLAHKIEIYACNENFKI